ncbi:Spore coat assembly protein ExsA [Clostridium ljungdahlii]|uniref:Spore coat assembly protein ExsA n=2 Tax=Clostridium ljungdahlii TaxID=1538 RepID=A0A168NNA6_9CLOT|nr:Spore coat assembly protein ExsA [Clostridium ljungdahlii]
MEEVINMSIDFIKENIECEQLLAENFSDTVIKAEYVIPDTNPDVKEILILNAKPSITNKEVMQDKVFVEGKIEYTLLYLAEESENMGIYSVNYTGSFSNYVEVPGTEHMMLCDSDCYVEHMNCTIANERKIVIEGIIKLKAEVYKKYEFEVIKDVTGSEDIQMLKNPATVDKIVGTVSGDLVAKTEIQISVDKPQVGSVLEYNINIHKKDIKVLEDKISVEAYVLIRMLYRGKDTRDIVCIEKDVFVNKELPMQGVNPSMESHTDFNIDEVEHTMREDDLGENRIVEIEVLVKSNTKVMYKEDMDIIEDAYSPSSLMQMEKEDYELNVMHGQNTTQSMVKSNIEINEGIKPTEVIMSYGDVCITDKKIVEDKVIVEGVLNAKILYKNSENQIEKSNEEIPFSCSVDIPESKIDMQCIAKVSLESIEGEIEVDTIAIKAVIEVYARVNYITHKEFLVNIDTLEGEFPDKKSSLTIYVVQQGDTLWKIAKKYYTTVENLVKLNSIEDPDVIKSGEKLIIPGRAVI